MFYKSNPPLEKSFKEWDATYHGLFGNLLKVATQVTICIY